jgi:hypothetical protein
MASRTYGNSPRAYFMSIDYFTFLFILAFEKKNNKKYKNLHSIDFDKKAREIFLENAYQMSPLNS